MRRGSSTPILLFLLGLGSYLQVVASLSLSEIFVLAAAPMLLFVGEYQKMQRTGVHKFFIFSVLVLVGCTINYFYFGSIPYYTLRRFAQVSIFVCSVPVMHWVLRREMAGIKWFLFGAAISIVLCTFIFKRSVEVSMYGADAQAIANGQIYWIQRLSGLIRLPATGWYLQTPLMYSIIAPMGFAVACALLSASGRSAALGAMAFSALVFFGGKTVSRMRKMRKMFWGLFFGALISIPIVTAVYGSLASNGVLGEAQQKKYMGQTHGEGGVFRLLIGGRAESVVGIYACMKNPILGFGLEGRDPHGYWEEFIEKYGSPDDVEAFYLAKEWFGKMGLSLADGGIPTHSYVGAFWTYYGMFGLFYWLYVFWVFFRYIKDDVAAVPQWYAWLACSIPAVLWDIFFSPVSSRIQIPLMVVACLITRAVRLGRQRLPPEMIKEIMRHAR